MGARVMVGFAAKMSWNAPESRRVHLASPKRDHAGLHGHTKCIDYDRLNPDARGYARAGQPSSVKFLFRAPGVLAISESSIRPCRVPVAVGLEKRGQQFLESSGLDTLSSFHRWPSAIGRVGSVIRLCG
jgi:hypothetical protein